MVLDAALEIEQPEAESETAPLLRFLGVERPSPTGIKVIAATAASVLLIILAAVIVRLPRPKSAPPIQLPEDAGTAAMNHSTCNDHKKFGGGGGGGGGGCMPLGMAPPCVGMLQTIC